LSSIRQEALFNEYKGNLYEFLVAHSIASHFDLELGFYEGLNTSMRSMLEHQETFLRDHYPNLLVQLPRLANSLKDELVNALEIESLDKVQLIGKVALASHEKEYAESDILLQGEHDYLISLKLAKVNSYLNTKSAGVKSFIGKYFLHFEQSAHFQRQFSNLFDHLFQEFAFKMHEIAQIDMDLDFKSWVSHGLPELPGELKGDFKTTFLELNHKLSQALYEVMQELYELDTNKFIQALFPLLGFSDSKIIQASTYYKKNQNAYVLSKHRIDKLNTNDIYCKLTKKDEVSYFDIQLSDRILQIRLKAMNKFINKGFKINCSVKYLD